MKISVVMATYNGEKFIHEQLESILHQTLSPDEVIICDDKSNDSTIGIIDNFISDNALNTWFLYANKNNLGYAGNFSNALKYATGDVIFLADQDDIWNSDKIKSMTDVMKKNENIDLLVSNVLAFYMGNDGNVVNYENFGRKLLINIKFGGRWIKPIRPGCSFCFKRSLLNNYYKVWFDSYPHDCLLWGLANINNSSYLLNQNTVKFRRHDSNASSRGNGKIEYRLNGIKNEIKIADKMIAYLYENEGFKQNKIEFIEKQRQIYIERYDSLSSRNIFRVLALLPSLKYYGRKRFWITDLYYILKK